MLEIVIIKRNVIYFMIGFGIKLVKFKYCLI